MENVKRVVRKYRNNLNPPYGKKDIPTILGTIFILLAIPLTVILALQIREPVGRTETVDNIVPRGSSGDMWADVILGQLNFSEVNPYQTVSDKLWLPHGVIVDRTTAQEKLYIFDAGNNRILGLDLENCYNLGTCSADLVIGQPSMNSSACNGDSGFQNYPVRAPAGRDTLCGEKESQLSITEGGSGASMVVDGSGNLYVPDFFNNRILKYVSPFTTDTLADDVWGQDNYRKNDCNKGKGNPDATSLCFTWGDSNNWTAGVDIEANGNLWVVDSGNNRTLRFPPGSKTADLVLGQSDFNSRSRGTNLNQMSDPCCVRVNSQGWVYVVEHKNGRVLRFKPPFTNGMVGEIFASGLKSPSGIDIDPTEPEAVWIVNQQNQTLELWDETTKTIRRKVGWEGNGNVLGDASGSVGIDSSGNILVALGIGNYSDDIILFEKGGSTTQPSRRLFNNHLPKNNVNSKEFGQAVTGVEVAGNQLVVSEENGRVLFWNNPNPANLSNGSPADGYLSGFSNTVIDGFDKRDKSCCMAIKAGNNHLWVKGNLAGGVPNRILVYQLPLTTGETPIKVLEGSIPTLDGGSIDLNKIGWGLAPSSDGSYLWVSQRDTNRVFRIKNPLLESPVVDAILGQTTSSGVLCNRGGMKNNTTLCKPSSLSFDNYGNLYVSDHALENTGNKRFLVFKENLFPTNNAEMIFAPAASKIFPNIATWEPAFDSQNRMVIGFNPYHDANPRGGWFPAVYNDPLSETTEPDYFLNDYYSMAFSTAFDESDNLYVADLNRGKVLAYKGPLPQAYAGDSCNTSFPNDKFHGCWFDGTNPSTGIFIGQRDEKSLASPVPERSTPVYYDYAFLRSDWGQRDIFSAVWRGNINFSQGDYVFKVKSDDGVRVDIGNDGTYEIDRWVTQPPPSQTSPISLNGYTPIKVEWFEGGAAARINFGWEKQVQGDNTNPLVSITSPANGTIVSGTVNMTATASDNVGVTKVEFYVDGVLKSMDISSPYSYSWGSTTASDGSYTIKAQAYDAAANVGSNEVSVTVANGDIEPPSTSTNLSATATAHNKVDLSWTASTDNVGVTGYWVVRDGVTIANVTSSTSYSDTTASPSTAYSYQVIATDAAGNLSPPSNTATVTTPSVPDTQAPTVPTGVSATAVSNSQINLSWNASSDNVGVVDYEVYRNSIRIATVSTTSYGNSGLSPSVTYEYYVKARDVAGNVSGPSNPASATTQAVPQVGTLVGTVTNANTGDPVVGALVTIKKAGSKGKKGLVTTATSNSSGVYAVTLNPGDYDIEAKISGYASQKKQATITASTTKTLDFSLTPKGKKGGRNR